MFTMQYMDLPPKLVEGMQEELNSKAHYKSLLELAEDKEDRDIITAIIKDETRHYNSISKLYHKVMGSSPVALAPHAPYFDSYIAGIKKAILDETKAYEFYRDAYLSSTSQEVRNMFFQAFTDENEHAIRLNFLYIKNK